MIKTYTPQVMRYESVIKRLKRKVMFEYVKIFCCISITVMACLL